MVPFMAQLTGATPEAGTAPSSPVIARAKLVPQLREDAVPRAHLVSRVLDPAVRLAVMSSPAGAGKTTLLAQCHAASPTAVWLTLDESDNDPVTLWWSLLEAVAAELDGFGAVSRRRLRTAGSAVLDEVVTSVANELSDRGADVLLCLDDVDRVTGTTSRQPLSRFVTLLCGGARVAMASRRGSPLPLGRLRVAGGLTEITSSDLAMSPTEAQALLNRGATRLAPDLVAGLVARTEGWPAGLQLAAVALTHTDDPVRFVHGFGGTDVTVADYLAAEVLGRLPGEQRRFLVTTSLLNRLCGGLCDAVTGRTDGAEFLATLEQANALVIRLDRDGVCFVTTPCSVSCSQPSCGAGLFRRYVNSTGERRPGCVTTVRSPQPSSTRWRPAAVATRRIWSVGIGGSSCTPGAWRPHAD